MFFVLSCFNNSNVSSVKRDDSIVKKTVKSEDLNKEYDTILSKAVIEGDIPVIKSSLQKGVDINIVESNGLTPFQLAILKGDIEVIKTFLLNMSGSDVKKINESQPILYLAVLTKNLELVKLLISEGFINHEIGLKDRVPLQLSSFLNLEEISAELQHLGADFRYGFDEKVSPLHYMVLKMRPEIILRTFYKAIYEGNVNAVSDGVSLIYFALENGKTEVAKGLLNIIYPATRLNLENILSLALYKKEDEFIKHVLSIIIFEYEVGNKLKAMFEYYNRTDFANMVNLAAK